MSDEPTTALTRQVMPLCATLAKVIQTQMVLRPRS
jgi:hypothetical protein